MNKTILGISLFFILLFLYLYKKREHFFGDVVYANNISSRCPADSVSVGSNSSSSSTANERNLETRMNLNFWTPSNRF